MRKSKPIRVFFSLLSHRFYATRAYTEDSETGMITVTGEKFDVTDDIAGLIQRYNLEFKIKEKEEE